MNFKPIFALSLGVAALSLAAPVFAGGTSTNFKVNTSNTYKVNTSTTYTQPGNIRLVNMCKVCVLWGKAQPGQLFGPCLRYEMQPCGPSGVK